MALPCSEDAFPPTRLLMVPPIMPLQLPPQPPVLPTVFRAPLVPVLVALEGGVLPVLLALLAPAVISQFQPDAVTTVWL